MGDVLGIKPVIIQGAELDEKGFGGTYKHNVTIEGRNPKFTFVMTDALQ